MSCCPDYHGGSVIIRVTIVNIEAVSIAETNIAFKIKHSGALSQEITKSMTIEDVQLFIEYILPTFYKIQKIMPVDSI
jgi:hypothetical protein